MVEIGARVRYVAHHTAPDGVVEDLNLFTDVVTVRWDNKHLIPPTQEFPKHMFFDGTFTVFPRTLISSTKCDCGAKYDRDMPEIHSHWCSTKERK